ncbi:COL6A3 [Branchiostoma lanceolatum]|uniref:COL6A3 protein n=1 Tax=Branchiostoma lanceolatum TaxID=7740 RepID=A0A8J9Z521_BRALA|nr:COL6A3 [Branchiostoma lanceolatum]
MGRVQNPATYRFALDSPAHFIGVSRLRRTTLRREDRADRDSTTTAMLGKLLLTTAMVLAAIHGSSAQVCSADIVLTLDESSSIPRTQFILARDFMLDFIECAAFQDKDIRIGVILYNCVPRTYFDLGKYTRNSPFMRGAIDYMMKEGGVTRTGVAIRYMRVTSDFRDGVPGAAVILTDGQTSDDYAYEAGAARAAGVDLYAVGVGFQALVDQTALETITDYSDRVFDTTQACVVAQKIVDDLCG